ncbi:MAG TPA: hypothetical protein VF196_02470 [Casimicrobiaceae bacterium]
MSIEGIVIGALGILLGAAFCFGGFRWFLLLLPFWGLFVGFTTGASAVSMLLGEGFLAGALGIIVGIVLALVFAVLAYLYWWGAVAVIAGALGYAATLGLLEIIGFSVDGFLAALLAVAVGVIVAIGAIVVNAPKYVAIILTAFAGASWLVAGVGLVLGLIKTTELDGGPIVAVYGQGILWIVAWGVVAAAGIIAQLQMTRRWEQDLVVAYESRKPPF